jgi:hypothetical protein
MGPSYRVNVVTGSALDSLPFELAASAEFDNQQEGILTNSGGDFFGALPSPLSCYFLVRAQPPPPSPLICVPRVL